MGLWRDCRALEGLQAATRTPKESSVMEKTGVIERLSVYHPVQRNR